MPGRTSGDYRVTPTRDKRRRLKQDGAFRAMGIYNTQIEAVMRGRVLAEAAKVDPRSPARYSSSLTFHDGGLQRVFPQRCGRSWITERNACSSETPSGQAEIDPGGGRASSTESRLLANFCLVVGCRLRSSWDSFGICLRLAVSVFVVGSLLALPSYADNLKRSDASDIVTSSTAEDSAPTATECSPGEQRCKVTPTGQAGGQNAQLLAVSTLNVEERQGDDDESSVARLRELARRFEQSVGPQTWGLLGLQELHGTRFTFPSVFGQELRGIRVTPKPLPCGNNRQLLFPVECFRQGLTNSSASGQYGMNGYVGSTLVQMVAGSPRALTFEVTQVGGMKRHVVGARFTVLSSGMIVPFYSVHMSNAKNGQVRVFKELVELMAAIHSWQQPGDLTPILAGDFNCTELSSDVRQVIYSSFYPASEDLDWADIIWVGRPQAFPGSAGALRREGASTVDTSVKDALLTDPYIMTSFLRYDAVTSQNPIPVPAPTGDPGCFNELTQFRISDYDFVPQSGGTYDANWVGPPRRDLRWADVKRYVPTFSIQQRATRRPVNINFGVMEERLLGDTRLGTLRVTLVPTNQGGGVLLTYVSEEGDARRPTGAPTEIHDSFWLGCTRAGRVRGNHGKGDDSHADVYLKMIWASEHRTITMPEKSRVHRVRCS